MNDSIEKRIFQRKGDTDRAARIANQERWRRLKAERGNDIFNSMIGWTMRAAVIAIEESRV